jgi:hypothetical protein
LPIFEPEICEPYFEGTRSRWFTQEPGRVLRQQFAGGAGEVQLYGLDTVLRDAWNNFRALGHADPLDVLALEQQIDANDAVPALRILATHHPIADIQSADRAPGSKEPMTMVLKNRGDLAARLAGATSGGARPWVHVVLSGHTHDLFPTPEEALPATANEARHAPLQPGQCQLVVSSAMQVEEFRRRIVTEEGEVEIENPSHIVEVLRCYHDEDDARSIVLERRIASRGRGPDGEAYGDYEFVDEGIPQEQRCILFTL